MDPTITMFEIVHMSDVVRIPPSRLKNSLKVTAIGILKEKYESMISPELGYVIMIIDANANSVGKLVAGDGATYHRVTFKALTFYPKLQEVVEGEVVEITDFGAFVRIGPTDALLHLSQITDDYLRSDVKQGVIVANQTAKSLKIGSRIRDNASSSDVFARIGDDEFALCLAGTDPENALRVAGALLEVVKKPVQIGRAKQPPAAAPMKEKKGGAGGNK